MKITEQPRHVTVHTEFDVVNLRHTVRQMARAIGLDLTRQAKITVAISAIARAFMSEEHDLVFTVRISHTPHPMLEIACVSTETHHTSDAAQLAKDLHLNEVRMLVDDFTLAIGNDAAHLNMRMDVKP